MRYFLRLFFLKYTWIICYISNTILYVVYYETRIFPSVFNKNIAYTITNHQIDCKSVIILNSNYLKFELQEIFFRKR